MDILYIVIPAYNEEENIRNVVAGWYPLLTGKDAESRLVVADSGSTDKTHSILVELRGKYPQLEILSTTEKQHGPKLMALYDYSIKSGAEYIFQTDSDGQTDPKEFEEFWNLRMYYDGIFGERHVRGDGEFRAFVEKVLCFLLKLYFGVKVPDANAPFRLMNVETVRKYLHRMPENYELPNVMMTVYFAYNKEKMIFKPISFAGRQGGYNSVHVLQIIKAGWKALKDFWMFRKWMK